MNHAKGIILSFLIIGAVTSPGPVWGQYTNSPLPLIETFKNSTPDNPDWVLGGFNNNSQPKPSFLTSGNVDTSGDGWLRLTQLENQPVFLANSFAYYNVPFVVGPGLRVSFDFASWGGSGADGISFYLFDGATRKFVPGVGAGALEYTPDGACFSPGLSNAYIGIGFDDYGNFSGLGCPASGAVIPNAVSIHGSGNRESGYGYLTGTATLPWELDVPFATSRPSQTGPAYRRATVYISPDLKVSVAIQVGSRAIPQTVIPPYDLLGAPGQMKLPPTLKFGFGGSEGGLDNYHDIRNIVVLPTTSRLTVSPNVAGPGDSVSLKGLGFGPFEIVSVFGGTNFIVPWFIFSTDSHGEFSATVTLPDQGQGYYELTGIGALGTAGVTSLLLVQ